MGCIRSVTLRFLPNLAPPLNDWLYEGDAGLGDWPPDCSPTYMFGGVFALEQIHNLKREQSDANILVEAVHSDAGYIEGRTRSGFDRVRPCGGTDRVCRDCRHGHRCEQNQYGLREYRE